MLRLFFLFLPFFLFTHSVHSEEVTETQMLQTFNALPLSFTENQGQVDSDVQFIARGDGGDMFFSAYETTFILQKNKEQTVEKKDVTSEPVTDESEYFVLKRQFLGTNSNLTAEGEEKLQWNTSYFIGNNPSQWHTGVPNYEKIHITNLYEGIDLVYYGDKNVLKYDLVIQPGADPSKVRFYYEGAEGYNVNNNGDLEIYTLSGTVIEKKPYSYQIIEGEKKEIDVNYKIIDKNFNTVAFEVSSYDNMYPLIIDPELEYATYLSGEGLGGIDVDDNGCLYVTCSTKSLDFPGISYGYHGRTDKPSRVILVVKFNSDFNGLAYSCLIGGDEQDYSYGIKADSDGNAFIIANTQSANFPVTDQAYLTERPMDLIEYLAVCKLNASGDSLLYSTYVGECTRSFMDIDNEGNVYIFGKTKYGEFPVTPEAYDKNAKDLFLCKLNSTGTDLVYSTFFGGSETEYPYGIAVDDSGYAYITGVTFSPDFPITYGTYSDYPGFISKFDPSGSELVYSTPIDKSAPRSITIDSSGNAYITGYANYEFHTTPEAYKTTSSGSSDVFALKLSPSGNELLYSTFIGGKTMGGSVSDNEIGLCIVVDNIGNAYITGFTSTNDFPTTSYAYDSSYGGGDYDAFICKLNPDGSELLYSTYLGGGKIDMGRGIAIDENGSVFIAGTTESWDFPITENAFDKKLKDMFVCKLTIDNMHYADENIPRLFLLKPPYPNPFNASTTISFKLPSTGFTQLVIYNITGQKVRELVAETMTAGIHNVMWDGMNESGNVLSSGVYISRLKIGNHVSNNLMLLLK